MTSRAPSNPRRLGLGALLLMLPALALAAAPQQKTQQPQGPVEVRADQATFEQKAGTGVYRGHAELIQGNRHLYADVIRLFTENQQLARVEATGNPVHMVEGDQFDATAKKLVYDLKTHQLVLTGDAHIKHQGNTFEGARVQYDLDSKRVDASGKGDKRVRLVIPAQSEEAARQRQKQPKKAPAPAQSAPASGPGNASEQAETH